MFTNDIKGPQKLVEGMQAAHGPQFGHVWFITRPILDEKYRKP